MIMVGLVAVPNTLNAVYAHLGGELQYAASRAWLFAGKAAEEVLLIALFFYVLRVNGERLRDFTRPARWRDVVVTPLVAVLSWLPYAVFMVTLLRWSPFGMRLEAPHNTAAFRTALTAPYLAFVLVNPFCEELWIRGFLQTRLAQLGWPAPIVVLTSASAQAAYHIYQGVPYLLGYFLTFGVLATYYQRTRRLWPIVGVHLITDVSAAIVYSSLG
jgi:membrane protease YdiL (CAAX protease family)